MLQSVNGLFGWMEANDQRSLALFGVFLAAFHVAAALVLAVPLIGFDPEHAPGLAWGGYAARYLLPVTLAAMSLFGAQLLWRVNAVRRLVAFDFVDETDEPRLCRIVEPLAISMGLPAPYVGVAQSPALNAFACGYRRKDAAIVVTRGLLDSLDDEELAAVVAHELAHIRNGDIRLMAAADACLFMLDRLIMPRMKQTSLLKEITGLPIVAILMPPALPFILLVSFIAQSALTAGRLSRKLISTSREFVADAIAIETTQNPAALVAALARIEGRSRLAGIAPGQDAMMIDGDAAGVFASHPPMADSVKAIIAVTGSMALNAPSRRDTRSADQKARAASAQPRATVTVARPSGALDRLLSGGDERSALGLTRAMTAGAGLAVAAVLALHPAALRDVDALKAAFDPRPFAAIVEIAARGGACSVYVLAAPVAGGATPEICRPGGMDALVAERGGDLGPVGMLFKSMTKDDGVFHGVNAAQSAR